MRNDLADRVMAVIDAEKDVSFVDKVQALGACVARVIAPRFRDDPVSYADAIADLKLRVLERITEKDSYVN
jgi:hypothetical protein